MRSATTSTADVSRDRERIRSEIVYETLSREDLPQLSRLIQATRRENEEVQQLRDHTPAYYDWMYFRNPAGPAVVVAGKHNGEIVSSFAITPKRIQFDGEAILCGKTMDMFTHPQYQGMGLIKEATSRVFRAAWDRGIRMWYVTPSESSYPIFLKKWRYVESCRVNYIVRVLDYSAVLSGVVQPRFFGRVAGGALNLGSAFLARVPAPDPEFTFQKERVFGPETDELWQRCRGYRVALVRDAAYLTWRYIDNPDGYDVVKVYARGGLRGILVSKFTLRRGLKVGEFVDCVTAPEDVDARRAIYRYGLRQFMSADCAFAQNWAIQGSRWEQEMKDCGIARRRRKMAILFSPDAPRQDFYDPKSWFLSPGDGNDL